MESWEFQSGFPVLNVARRNGVVQLTQNGYNAHVGNVYTIPITFATKKNPNFDNATAVTWMETATLTLPTEDDEEWIVFNTRVTGYYLVNYDRELWLLITEALKTDHEVIHRLNRAKFFDDIQKLPGVVDIDVLLDLISYLAIEIEFVVWLKVVDNVRFLETRIRGTLVVENFKNLIHEQSMLIYETTRTQSDSEEKLVQDVNFIACQAGNHACLEQELQILVDLMESNEIPSNHFDRRPGFMIANETVWMHFWNRFINAERFSPDSRWLIPLAFSLDPEILSFYIRSTINETLNFVPDSNRNSILVEVAFASNLGYNLVVQFIRDEHENLNRM